MESISHLKPPSVAVTSQVFSFFGWPPAMYFALDGPICFFPKDPICMSEKRENNPMTCGWDVSTINPNLRREGSGFLGLLLKSFG